MIRMSRRGVLKAAAVALAAPHVACRGCSSLFGGDPFKLGVASGSPTADGVVLWTRLARDPLEAGGDMPGELIEVDWEVAADERFAEIVQRGTEHANPDDAHSVHAEVSGLEPDRWYWYRFIEGKHVSPAGRTRTLARAGSANERLRFALGSCQHYEHGYYSAHRDLLSQEIDLVIFVGDYIYESSWGRPGVRQHKTPVARTLDGYRERYAQYRTDLDLQRLHAHVPWLVTWDDHEVSNDYAGLRDEALDPTFRERRAAAYQAFWEHMPLRRSQRPDVIGSMRLHDRFRAGDLAEIFLLDGRQHRSKQPCGKPGAGGSSIVRACPELEDPQGTFLGHDQERWLAEGLAGAGASWTILAQQTLMAPMDRERGGGRTVWTDTWDGYPAARKRLLDQLVSHQVPNPVVIGGDLHTNVVAELRADPDDPSSAIVASEFCGTSMTSQGPEQAAMSAHQAENPHLKLIRSDKRGYVLFDLTEDRLVAKLRAVDDERDPESGVTTIASFTVEAGRPGPVRG